MRIGVVADATCDLPQEFIQQHGIRILPISIRLGDEMLVDERDPELTLRFYTESLASKGLDAETVPYSAEQIRAVFLERVVIDQDFALVLTVSSTRSPIFENATKASFSILNDYKPVRAAAGISGPFAMRVVDSKSLFSGTAVLVAEAQMLAEEGIAPNELRRRVEDLSESVCAYMVPKDLYYVRNRAMKKGDNSVGWMTYAVGTALDIKPVLHAWRGETRPVAKVRHFEAAVERMFGHVTRQILTGGVRSRYVCICHGGDPDAVLSMPGYEALAEAARQNGLTVQRSIMSATAAVNVGGGCVGIAFAGDHVPFAS